MQRVMKKTDLPGGVSALEVFVHPGQFLRIHVVAIEREELGVPLLESIIALPGHVEWFVETLVGIVVVTQ